MRAFLILTIFLFTCSLLRKDASWVSYEVKYIESEKQLTEFVMDITSRGYDYRVINHKDNICEVQYRKMGRR